ncbi:MAG: DUF3127 domain-containing protein [Bacteroidota bacterium]
MEISGKLYKVLPLVTGQGKNGEWRKQDIVIETQAQFPKKVCMSLWGDKIDQLKFSEGDAITLSFDLESREYNGRWFTEARAWKVVGESAGPSSGGSAVPPYVDMVPDAEPGDDLPF